MKNCPLCSRDVVVTASLRPDNWPHALLYHACNYCSWEEQDFLLRDASYIKKKLNELKNVKSTSSA